jgi:O-antigen/teichoic acid export membrane protein
MARSAEATVQQRSIVTRLRNDRLLRNSAIYLGGGLGAGLLGYVFHFVTGRLLGPARYADVAAVLAALYLTSLPGLVVQTVSTRFVSIAIGRGQEGSIPGLLARVTAISLAFGVLGAATLAALAPFVTSYLQLPRVQLVYVLAVASVIALLVAANRGALQGMRRFWALSVNTVLDLAVRVLAGGALIVAGLGALGGILALIIGPLAAYGQSLWLLRRRGAVATTSGPPLTEVGRYAVSASLAAIGVTYLFNVDVLLAKHYLPAQAAGVYAAGSILARAVYFLGLTVTAVMFPEVATLHARNQAHFHIVDRSLIMLGVVGVGFVLAYLAVPGLVLIPYGSGYEPVKPYLGPFAMALALLAVSNLLVNYFLSVDSRRFVIPLAAVCVLETVLIVAFHDGIAQIVAMLLISMAVLSALLGGLFVFDRRRGPA